MKYVRHAFFAVWAVLCLHGAAYIALIISFIMGERYDEMHSLSTARDPDPSLTRDMVVSNVLRESAKAVPALLLCIGVVWVIYGCIFSDRELVEYKKAGFWLACACSLILALGVVGAGVLCLNTYPQR